MDELVEIPYQELSPEALRGILEEYATRGGFESDIDSIDHRVDQLVARLRKGQLKIVFDPASGATNLAPC